MISTETYGLDMTYFCICVGNATGSLDIVQVNWKGWGKVRVLDWRLESGHSGSTNFFTETFSTACQLKHYKVF